MIIHRRFMRYLWILGVIALLGSALGARALLNPGQANNGKSAEKEPPADFGPAVVCLGYVDVEPGVIPLYPSQLGRVTDVVQEVDAKGQVKIYHKGEVLLRIDRRAAEGVLAEAEADLAGAQEKLAQARKLPPQKRDEGIKQQKLAIEGAEAQLKAAQHECAYKRFQQEKGNLDVNILKAAEAAVEALRKKVAAAEARLEEIQNEDVLAPTRLAENLVAAKKARVKQARLALEECDLAAPMDGKVLRVLATPGELLGSAPKQPALWFCPTARPPIIRVEVQQEYAARVARDKKAVIEDDTRAAQHWTGKVVRLSDWYTHRRSIVLEPLQFNDVRTMECIVVVDPGQPQLRIGQRVRVTIGGP